MTPVAGTRALDVEHALRWTDIDRERIREQVTAWFDVTLTALALLALALLLLELSGTFGEPWTSRVIEAQLAIWAVFVVAFLIELWLAPARVDYLRNHWLVVLSLALPLFRIFRVFRAVRFLRATRAARGLNLARVGAALNRGAREIREFSRVSYVLYLALLTTAVTLTAGVAVYALERDTNPELATIGEALWWAGTVVTTVNASAETVTLEGRVVSMLLRVFGLGVTGFVTARLAVFFLVPRDREDEDTTPLEEDETAREVRALRDEVARLASLLEREDRDEEPVRRRWGRRG